MADYRRRLAERMKAEREARSLSRQALALRSDVSDKTIKRIELQQVDNPRPLTIRRIAEALDIDPAVLRPPPEIEADQLNRIEEKLDRLLRAIGAAIAPPADEGDPEELEQAARALEAENEPPEEKGDATGTQEAGG